MWFAVYNLTSTLKQSRIFLAVLKLSRCGNLTVTRLKLKVNELSLPNLHSDFFFPSCVAEHMTNILSLLEVNTKARGQTGRDIWTNVHALFYFKVKYDHSDSDSSQRW